MSGQSTFAQQRAGQSRRILWRNYAGQNNNSNPKQESGTRGMEQEDAENCQPGENGDIRGLWKMPGHKIFERLVVRLGKRSEALQMRNTAGADQESEDPTNGESFLVGSVFDEFVLYEIFSGSSSSKTLIKETSDLKVPADVVGTMFEQHKRFVMEVGREGWRLRFVVVVQFDGEEVQEAAVDRLLEELYKDVRTLEKICVLSQCQQPQGKGRRRSSLTSFCAQDFSLDFLKWNSGLETDGQDSGTPTEIRFRFKRGVLEQLKQFGDKHNMNVQYFGPLVFGLALHKCTQAEKVNLRFDSGTVLAVNFRKERNIEQLIEQLRCQLSSRRESNATADTGDELAWAGAEILNSARKEIFVSEELVVEQQICQKAIKYCFRFSRGALDETLVRQFVDFFRTLFMDLLKDGLSGSLREVGEYRLLSEGQVRQLVHDWNATQRPDYQLDVSVVAMFEARVAAEPGTVALTCGTTQWSYDHLNKKANQVAHHLRRVYGLGSSQQSELVAVSMERSPEVMVAILGVLKAGGAYVPIDPNYPTERVQYMLQDSEAKVVLTQPNLLDKLCLDGSGTAVLALDTEMNSVREESEENPNWSLDFAERVAYVIYTSGSTGRPKGVMIRHRNLSNYLYWCKEQYVAGRGQVALYSSISFDLTITSIFAPLVCGVSICITPSASFDRILDQWEDSQFEFLKMTPSHLDLLIAHRQASGLLERPLTNTFIVGGENLNYSQVRSLLDGHTRIINEYGPTETTVGCTTHTVTHAPDQCMGSIPIGRAIANMQMYVLDGDLQLVPVGCVGELYIGGAGVGLGYWKRPDLTEEKFVPNPFAETGSRDGRMYRTGDLGRWTPDGNLVFLGRIDDQVKIRGFRVELPEIESALDQFPNVRQCAVCVEEQTLVAYLIHQEPKLGMDVSALREHLSGRLPVHMVPASFALLPTGAAFPLSPGGKIDKKQLVKMQTVRLDETAVFVSGRNEMETNVAEIWARILRVARVGIDDDFFRLGGDSIKCMQLVAELNKLLPAHRFHSGQVYAQPTIRRLFDSLLVRRRSSCFWNTLPAEFKDSPACKKQARNKSNTVTVEFELPKRAHAAYGTRDEDLLLTAYALCLSKLAGGFVHHVTVYHENWTSPLRLEVVDGDKSNSLKNVKEMRAWAEQEVKLNGLPELDLAKAPQVCFGESGPLLVDDGLEQFRVTLDECIDGSESTRVHVTWRTTYGENFMNVLREHLMSAVAELVSHCDEQPPLSAVNHTMSDFSGDFEPFVVYKDNEDGTDTVFLFPPALGGSEAYLGNICRHMPDTKRLVLLNNWYLHLARKFGDEYTSEATLETVAAEYIRLMKREQARGPYQLFGWSFGGLVAAEVCRQLVEVHNDQVAKLVMVDPLFNFRTAAEAVSSDVELCLRRYHVNYAYEPPSWSVPSGTDVILFKAVVGVCGAKDLGWMDEEYRSFYDAFNFDTIYAYYANETANNHLDTILEPEDFKTVGMGDCNHFSWADDETQVLTIAEQINTPAARA